ncbi:SNF2 family helicase/ATPase-like protein [Phyllosticta capitalensis]
MLLNPKGKGTTKRQRTDSPSAESKRPRVEQTKYDPRALLNPKAAAAAKQEEKSQSQSTNHEEDGGPGMGSMIERMHGIQRREDQPVKTKHAAQPGQEEEVETKKSKFNGASGGSVLSEYVAEKKKEGAMEAGPSAIVDLTDDKEDDDDLVITGAAQASPEEARKFGFNNNFEANRVVCLGKLEEAYANYTIVPSPAAGFSGSSSVWPAIKVTFRRRPGQHNFFISLVDVRGIDFGQLDIRTAMALVPLIDARNLNVKIACRIDPRRKRDGEVAGGHASNRLAVNINIFAPRKHAKDIGRNLSQSQTWLRPPTAPIGSYPFENPQSIQAAAPKNQAQRSSTTYTMTRTQEEIRSDVISMFDSLAKSDDIPEMEPDEQITTPLLPHQKQALHFMTSRERAENDNGLWKLSAGSKWYNIITGIDYKRKPEPVRGGILADMMGLGKTLEILSLIAATKQEARAFASMAPPQVGLDVNGGASDHSRPSVLLRCNSRATLLVCPLSTIANWQEQIAAHTKGLSYCIYHGPNRETVAKELAKHDIVITTYQVVSSEYNQSKPLSQINWFRITLDEAHMIRSQSTKQSLACCALQGLNRWPLTATPIQNRLEDLGALIKFLRVKPFDEKNGYTQYIVTPFKNADPEILPKLRILVDSITLRRQKDKINLPPRHDLVVRLDFSIDERQLFDLFAKDTFRRMQAMTAGRESLAKNDMGHVLKAISRLRLICAHGAELLSDEDMKIAEGMTIKGAIEIDEDDDEDEQNKKQALTERQAYSMLNLMRESEIDICGLCDKQLRSQTSAENSDDEISNSKRDHEDTIGYMTPCFHLLCSSAECLGTYKERLNASTAKESTSWRDYADCPLCNTWIRKSLFRLKQSELDREEAAKARVTANMNSSTAKRIARYGGPHTKVKALIEDLQRNQQWSQAHPNEPPLKSVVFSGWTSYLDLISIALSDQDIPHTRLDGTMSRQKRADALAAFKNDPHIEVFLISITAGGLGLNLTTGSKAYVMEPQYNPAAEAQAVDRVHRLGQTREVTVTRFIMKDSFEERMLELQQKKKDLADLSMNRNVKLDKHEAAKRKLEDLRSLFR